jgi:hypothetical protein
MKRRVRPRGSNGKNAIVPVGLTSAGARMKIDRASARVKIEMTEGGCMRITMTNKRIIGILILAFLWLSTTHKAQACTIFSASDGETVLFGGNEDQTPNTSFMVVDKRGKYGVIYFATPWQQWPLVMQMGINEKGLCYDSNAIPEEKLAPNPRGKVATEWAITELMAECSTVKEVLKRIDRYNLGGSITYQVHFADASGDAAVVHPGKAGKLDFTRKPREKGFLISTNFNLLKVKTKKSSCWRYMKAEKMLSEIQAAHGLSVESMASVLEGTHQEPPYRTLYSAVYDLRKLKIFLYYDCDFTSPVVFDLASELARVPKYEKTPLTDIVHGTTQKAGAADR